VERGKNPFFMGLAIERDDKRSDVRVSKFTSRTLGTPKQKSDI
jgi:hypothetical protein